MHYKLMCRSTLKTNMYELCITYLQCMSLSMIFLAHLDTSQTTFTWSFGHCCLCCSLFSMSLCLQSLSDLSFSSSLHASVCVCEWWMKSQRAGLPLCMPQAKPFLGGLLWDLHPGWIRALDLISISLFTSAHKRKRSAAQKHANWCWERHGEV